MRIVLDAMGSDKAPEPEIKGAVDASLLSESEIVLVGDKPALEASLEQYSKHGNISVVHATESVTMHDSPMVAVRKKKNSSLMVGLRLVKEGKADAFLSAGNTGAVMLGARVILGPIPGVSRSAICQVLPTCGNPVLVLDLGANVDCSAKHLCQFAEMGVVFSRLTLGVENPSVGLLNIGEESAKGNEVAKAVHQSLTATPHINFIGNIEPNGIYEGKTDVVICDGFVGNVVLKTSEAVAHLMKTLVERETRATWLSMLGGFLSLGTYRRVLKTTDANEFTGAPLLGVKGIVVILHGSCKARGVTSAIMGAEAELELGLNEHIRKGIEELVFDSQQMAAAESAK